MTNTVTSREDWLNAFTAAARPTFEQAGFPLPENVRVSVGFSSRGRKSKAIGECWSNTASADDHFEIFISPSFQSDSAFMADILTHELCHVATPGAGHGKAFKKCALAVGLAGKMTQAGFPNKVPPPWAQAILDDLCQLPGADLNGAVSLTGPKKQTSRLLKQTCNDCGLTLRITATWLNACGTLQCPDKLCSGDMSGE